MLIICVFLLGFVQSQDFVQPINSIATNTYHQNFESDIDKGFLLDSIVYYSFSSQFDSLRDIKIEYNYSELGYLIEEINSNWLGSAKIWMPTNRRVNEVDENGNITYSVWYSWNITFTVWEQIINGPSRKMVTSSSIGLYSQISSTYQ